MSNPPKLIAASDLQLGMFICKLGGSWLRHPFVRSSFQLDDPQDIQRILDAGITEVWIDEEKGIVPEAAPSPDEAAPDEPSSQQTTQRGRTRNAPVTMTAEVQRARRICDAAKEQVESMFQDVRMGKTMDADATLPLVMEITDSISRHPSAIISVARLKTHDNYTYLHSVAVCALMIALARQLGLSEEETRIAGHGGLMHDLGKALMPLDVLNKPGKLTDEEFGIMKSHPAAGAQLLLTSGASAEVQDIALHHHEKIDGRGYPHGLKGEEITLLSRMGACCDVYDAITSERSYKNPWDPAHAMREMARWEGQFDKRVFNAFVKSVGIYPVGSLVRLESQRLAVVVEQHSTSLLTPRVCAFFSLRSREPVAKQTINLAAPGCTDRIVSLENPEKWNFTHLDEFWQQGAHGA